jgi:acetolactate synthase-1/2/3 large subunit
VRSADVLVVVGETPAEVTTAGYTLLTVPEPAQFLVHAHPSSSELGRIFKTNLPVHSTPTAFARALSRLKPPANRRWARLRQDLRGIYERSLKPKVTPGNVRLEEVIEALSSELPEEAIITNGAGNYASFLHRYFRYKGYPTQLAPTSGSMGYGLPAAIAAKLAYPERPVVALAGDGCLLMTAQELATAIQYGLPIVIIVANNGMYGTIRMHQEHHFPGRVVGTSLVNPDFAALACSYGASGVTIGKTEEFVPVLRRALAAPVASVIELKLDPEAISPLKTLTEIRANKKKDK